MRDFLVKADFPSELPENGRKTEGLIDLNCFKEKY